MTPAVTTEISQEKYIILRLNNVRLPVDRNDYQQPGRPSLDRKMKMTTGKPLICSNQKYITVAMGSMITFFHEHKLKRSFKKKEKAKRFNEAEGEEAFEAGKKMNVPFEIVDMSYSDRAENYLGVLGNGQFSLVNTSHVNREFRDTTLRSMRVVRGRPSSSGSTAKATSLC